MSYVCLWSPSWPTGGAFPVELSAALLAHAPRITVGDAGCVWADARGLDARALAESLVAVVRERGIADVRAGVAMTPIAAEVGAVMHEGQLPAEALGSRRSALGTESEARLAAAPPLACEPREVPPEAIERARPRAPLASEFAPRAEGREPRAPASVAVDVAVNVAAELPPIPLVVRSIRLGTDRDFLAPYPIHVLYPDERLLPILDGLGIERCGELARLSAESVEVRLGAGGVRLWDRANARDDRVLFRQPLRALPQASLEWTDYTLRDPERLLFVVNALAGQLCAALTERGERAREVGLIFSLAGRKQYAHLLRSAQPSADQRKWLRLARAALERIVLPDAVTGVSLRVEKVTGNDGAQGDLFDRGFASAGAVEEALGALVDDQGPVLVAPRTSAHPLLDARTEWVPVALGDVAAGRPAAASAAGATDVPRDESFRLALQLVDPPETIRVETSPRRDHEIPVRYRDQHGWHELVDVAGPDRVSGGEWEKPYAREYYRCVREDGMLVWMYRADGWWLQGWWD
ncbi:MAG: DinB/UmuC family translesion DNA polymerase [Gemmatimonadaceae bacterium]